MPGDSSREPLARLVEAKWLRDDPPGSLLRNLPQIAIAFAAIGRSAAFPLVPNHQSVKPSEDDRSSNRNQDRVNGPTLPLESDRAHDPAADDCARDTDQDIYKRAITRATHNFSGSPSRNQAHYDPP